MNRLLKTSEAAKLLRVSSRTVLNWIENDAIPYVVLPQPEGSEAPRQHRIPLYGLLSSLEGTYDLADLIAEMDQGVVAAQVEPPAEQEEVARSVDAGISTAEEAVEHLHAEPA
jgi:hypothetical protein